ncbi:MAG: peptidase U32 family protein [Candidatus Woesearchaeota archaeon]
MCPAGDMKSLQAAIKAGADSVYFGVGNLNMRSRAAKFEFDDLKKVANICKENNVKSYLTLNTVMYDEDIESMKETCKKAKDNGISAIIASDISVIRYANSIDLEVHMSTQANISNYEAVKFYSQYADVIVLARELSLEQIKNIIQKIKENNLCGPNGDLVKIEVFVHGALCVAISGKCYMSLAQYNESANRGKCLQSCRRKYKVTDVETNKELIIDNQYVMSPKDLSTISMIDKLITAGVNVFKIEGRARGPNYVYNVVKTYSDAIDAYENDKYTDKNVKQWKKDLKSVFNRGFWEKGYYLGKKLGEWSGVYGSKATTKKVQLGRVVNYYKKPNIAEIEIYHNKVSLDEKLFITGNKTGAVYQKVESIYLDEKPINTANKKDIVTIPVDEVVRKNDEVYKIVKK